MKTLTRNGLSIDEYIPRELRQMFYRNPNPEHRYAKRNGYSSYAFSTKGLVLYLPLWALKGSAFKSVDAYRHTCTVTGALWRPSGRLFDGTDDNIDCGAGTALQVDTICTLEVWYKSVGDASANGAGVFGRTNLRIYQPTANLPLGLTIYLVTDEGANWVNFAALTADTWHHLAFTFDNSLGLANIKLYKDSVAGTAQNRQGTMAGTTDTWNLGASVDGYVNAYIGEVRTYNRALSAIEIAHNYQATKWRYQ